MSEEYRPLTVSRDKLTRALANQPEVVRAFEQLVQRVGMELPGDYAAFTLGIEEAQQAGDTALSLAAAAQAIAMAAASEAKAAALSVQVEELRGLLLRLRREVRALQEGITA